jgi:tetratricopeptide (TPR) repeat protein
MLTMWSYVHYVDRPSPQRYLLMLLAFALGLMSKPMLVTLPFVLLLMDYWPLGRLTLRRPDKVRSPQTSHHIDPGAKKPAVLELVLEKVPLLALAAAVSVATLFAQPGHDSAVLPLKIRLGNAFVSYVSYIAQMLWPQGLAAFYPHPAYTLQMWEVLGSALLLICMSVLVIRAVRMRPYLTVGWLWYLGTLVPVIGLVPVGEHAMADRYTYVPLIGLFILVAWGPPDLLRGSRYRRTALVSCAGALLLGLMMCAWVQVGHWRSAIALFTQAINVTSDNYLAHNNLGVALASQGRHEEATRHYSEALRIKPQYAKAHNNLGVALAQLGNVEEAVKHFAEALRVKPQYADEYNSLGLALARLGEPQYADAHNNLGLVLASQGKHEEAMRHYSEALRIEPQYADAHNNLGVALARLGNVEEAVKHFAEALRIKPQYADAHNNLGLVLASQGRHEEAMSHYSEALRIKPQYADAHNNLGIALAREEKFHEAVEHYLEALRIKPDFANAHYNLGNAMDEQGMLGEAAGHYSEALRINPDHADAHNNLGLALAQLGDVEEAVKHFGEALRVNPDNSGARHNMELGVRLMGKHSRNSAP